MRVDLHLHSPLSSLNGDSIKWSSNLDTIKILINNKVKVISFTDHNAFSSKLYFDLKEIVRSNIIIFPGVEVDVIKNDGSKAHVLVIFSNELTNTEVKEIEKICVKELNKNGISVEKINDLFQAYQTIRIPHVGKGDNFKPSELSSLVHDAIETTAMTNPNFVKWQKELNNKSVVAFSDTHRWKDKLEQDFLFTDIDFDGSFKQLKEKLNERKVYTKTLMG